MTIVFPQHGYKQIKASTQQEWNDLINEAYKYCKNITNIFEFDGKCKPTDLPSFHPYWRNEVKKVDLRTAERLEQQLKEAGGSTYIFERTFSRNTSPFAIRERIEKLRENAKGVVL